MVAQQRANSVSRRRAAAAPSRRRASPLRHAQRCFWRLLAVCVAVPVLWVAAYRVIDPPGGFYMASEWLRLGGIERDWRDLDEIAPALARSAMAAEDARFCEHFGFDFAAIRDALRAREEGGRVRGASTISQQVAKNVFLWHDRSWVRKGLEAGFTLLLEALWPKRRILEAYLNTAEFAPGVFGAEAAARHHFGRAAESLSAEQTARLAAVLPAPKTRSAADPSGFVRRRAAAIRSGAETLRAEGRDACVF